MKTLVFRIISSWFLIFSLVNLKICWRHLFSTRNCLIFYLILGLHVAKYRHEVRGTIYMYIVSSCSPRMYGVAPCGLLNIKDPPHAVHWLTDCCELWTQHARRHGMRVERMNCNFQTCIFITICRERPFSHVWAINIVKRQTAINCEWSLSLGFVDDTTSSWYFVTVVIFARHHTRMALTYKYE